MSMNVLSDCRSVVVDTARDTLREPLERRSTRETNRCGRLEYQAHTTINSIALYRICLTRHSTAHHGRDAVLTGIHTAILAPKQLGLHDGTYTVYAR